MVIIYSFHSYITGLLCQIGRGVLHWLDISVTATSIITNSIITNMGCHEKTKADQDHQTFPNHAKFNTRKYFLQEKSCNALLSNLHAGNFCMFFLPSADFCSSKFTFSNKQSRSGLTFCWVGSGYKLFCNANQQKILEVKELINCSKCFLLVVLLA